MVDPAVVAEAHREPRADEMAPAERIRWQIAGHGGLNLQISSRRRVHVVDQDDRRLASGQRPSPVCGAIPCSWPASRSVVLSSPGGTLAANSSYLAWPTEATCTGLV